MDSFLESAQKLEVEGMLGAKEEHFNEEDISSPIDIMQDLDNELEERRIVETERAQRRQHPRTPLNDITKFDVRSLTPEEIDQKTEELYEKKDKIFSCLACEYTSQRKEHIRRHIEVHFDGISYTCSLCSKEFRSKNSLIKHKSILH